MKNKVTEKGKSSNSGSCVLHLFIATCLSLVLFSGISFAQTTNKANSEWLTFNGGFDATRFSALNQITPKNVGRL